VLGASLLMVLVGAICPERSDAQDFSTYTGSELFGRFCASCHGSRGEGDGPVSNSLRVMVPDLTRLSIRHGGTFPEDAVRRIIDGRTVKPPHGPRYMPVWGYEFRAAESQPQSAERKAELVLDKLVEYLQLIQADAKPNAHPH
jgi:mono/diheme cytochrome c family protein